MPGWLVVAALAVGAAIWVADRIEWRGERRDRKAARR
jgi:hypothetical protein